MADTLADVYLGLQAKMELLYHGGRVRSTAETILESLPDGPLELISTSDAGAGLAAVCAALRSDPTTWRKVNLLLPAAPSAAVVAIEPIDGGAAWRHAVERRYPGAVIVVAEPSRQLSAAA